MTTHADFERSQTFIQCQLEAPKAAHTTARQARLAVTISRETGTGGLAIARKLATYLQTRGPNQDHPWTVFDKNIVEQVIEEHHLPRETARYMAEDRISALDDIIEELFGLHPSAWTMLQKISQTILHLADQGNTILVGRGATILTQKLPHVFHVRIIGTFERRVARLCQSENLGPQKARETILKSDQSRERYVLQNFHRHVDNPLFYDLVLNTDRLNDELAARLIGDAALGACREARTPELAKAA